MVALLKVILSHKQTENVNLTQLVRFKISYIFMQQQHENG